MGVVFVINLFNGTADNNLNDEYFRNTSLVIG